MVLWRVALVCILYICGSDCANQPNPPDDSSTLQCYKCDAEHVFPHCEIQLCRHDEFCWLSNRHRTPYSKCVPLHECHHDTIEATCSLGSIFQCEKCCADEPCVNTHFTQLVQAHQFTAQPYTLAQTQPTTTPTPTATPNTGSHIFLQRECVDKLVGQVCMDTREISCKDHRGISLCAETCGLCGLLRERFGNDGTCRDQVVGDECSTYRDMCGTVMAEIACPVRCNKCDIVLENLFDKVSKMNHSIVIKPPVTPPATATAFTPSASSTVPCTDNAENCIALDHVCNTAFAGQICRKFCNLCSSNSVNPGTMIG